MADLTLLASNATTAIIMTQIISMFFLKEEFMCFYDFPALLLMSIGCFMIVLNANISEKKTWTTTEIKSIVLAPAFFVFMFLCVALAIFAHIYLKRLLVSLLKFERDAQEEDDRNQREARIASSLNNDGATASRMNSILPDINNDDFDGYDSVE